jgi:formylglycine-generating enzyme required for sulfatase activity
VRLVRVGQKKGKFSAERGAQAQYEIAQQNAPGTNRVTMLKTRLDQALAEAERQRKEKEKQQKPAEDDSQPSIPIDTDLPRNYTETVNGVSFTMIYVEGGTFQMGDTLGEGYSDEKPAHPVTLDGYHLGQTEVTQALWQAVMGANPSGFKNCGQCPVEQVSWEEAQAFIQKLNQLTGKKYALPTEAQWEYAARERGRRVRFGNGQDILRPSEANFDASEEYSPTPRWASTAKKPPRSKPLPPTPWGCTI